MISLFESPDDLAHFCEHGWWHGPDVIQPEMAALLRMECLAEWEAGAFGEAGIGSGIHHHRNEQIRRDFVHWWAAAPESPVRQQFLNLANAIADLLNRNLFLALKEVELHYAVYPPGGFYQRHLDQFRDRNNRQISMVVFLNEAWSPADGGQLRIYASEGFVDIPPRIGTMVLFRSDQVEHEVLPTAQTRLSLTGWFKNRSWPLV